MDFKDRVKDSFAKIKSDFDVMATEVKSVSGRVNSVENMNESIEAVLASVSKKIDSYGEMLAAMSKKINEIDSRQIQLGLESDGISPVGVVQNGKSSIGNKGAGDELSSAGGVDSNPMVSDGTSSIGNGGSCLGLPSAGYKKNNPMVSDGTSPKVNTVSSVRTVKSSSVVMKGVRVESRRSSKIKDKILSLNLEEMSLKMIFEKIVIDDFLCSKTSFYRFIKEMENDKQVEVFLDSGKRMIKKI